MMNNPRAFETYEQVAAFLLQRMRTRLGLERVEGSSTLQGSRSGTRWNIDAKGVLEGNEGFIIIECRRHTTSRPKQEDLGALAYRIRDTGAFGGIIVSPLGIQEGGKKVAAEEDVVEVQINV